MAERLAIIQLEGYVLEVGAALWRLAECRSRTLDLLQGISGEYLDRDAYGNTIGTILYHLALIEADWLYTEILEQEPPEEIRNLFPVDARDSRGILSLVSGLTLEQHIERLSAVRTRMLDLLRTMTAEDFQRPRIFPRYEVTPAWVLHHIARHEDEHRGEIGAIHTFFKSSGEGR